MATNYGASVYGTVQSNKPQKLEAYNPEYKPGQTTDLSSLKQAIGTTPRQVQTPRAQTGQIFRLSDLQGRIDQASQAGTNPAVAPERFQTPEQLGQNISQITQALRPQTEVQQQAATSAYNQAIQRLQSQWASRGLGASGAAAAQERQGAEGLAQQMAAIEANQQANAIPLALQYGQLGLQEAGQRFAQEANIRDFDQSRVQQAIQNYLAGMGQQEQMRQFEQGLGMDVERLRSQEQQNYLDAMARYLGMEQQQGQWSQEFGLSRQAQDFSRWLQTQQLNQGAQSDWMGNLISAGGLAQEGEKMTLDEAYRQQQARESQRQFNIGAATDLSRIFGTAIQPKMEGQSLFNQVQGMQTQEARQQSIANALAAIGLMGQAPGAANLPQGFDWMAGRQTFESMNATEQRALQEQLANLNNTAAWARTTYQTPLEQAMGQAKSAAIQRYMAGKASPEDRALLGFGATNPVSTNKAVSDILTAPSKDEAFNLLNASIANGEFTDADLQQVLKAINTKWPASSETLPSFAVPNK